MKTSPFTERHKLYEEGRVGVDINHYYVKTIRTLCPTKIKWPEIF
jgi:hypothetical protein